MTVTGGSALPKDDIDRMMREAEQYADEDHKRREAAETRNQGEQLAYQTEKFIADNKDKLPEDVKSEVETAIADLKEKLKNESAEDGNTASIREATERVATISQKLGQALYANPQADAAGPSDAPAGEQPHAAAEDDVVDAEIVDDEKKDGAA
jgi:molecular chaperone DnaK